ncbi:hypothetical protein Tco_0323410, partial [Tanacetum coccineum]
MANFAGKMEGNDEWAVDSGATEHITYDSDFLVNIIDSKFKDLVTIANGTKVLVKGKVGQLANDLQCVVSFFPDFCVIQSLRTRGLIGAGRLEKGPYRMGMTGHEKKA